MRIEMDHETFRVAVTDRPWWRAFTLRVRVFHGLCRPHFRTNAVHEWVIPATGVKAKDPLRDQLNMMLMFQRGDSMQCRLMVLEQKLQQLEEKLKGDAKK